MVVPSAETAGATLIPGRCEPQAAGKNGATAVGLGGQGKAGWGFRLPKVPGQVSEVPGGAPGLSEAKVAKVEVSSGAIFTSQAPTASFWSQGLPTIFSSITFE